MRHVIFLLVLFFCSPVFADPVRVVFKPDNTTAVIYPGKESCKVNENQGDCLNRVFSLAMQGELANLPYEDMDSSELPATREDRNFWKKGNGKKIEIDNLKKKEKEDARKAKKTKVLQKLGLTEAEFQELKDVLE